MKKIFSIVLSMVIVVSALSMSATATNVDMNEPSDLFMELYTEVFLQSDTYEVYNKNGSCITDAFISEYYENYENSDFITIWNAVAENGYVLKYGEPQYLQDEMQSRTTEETYTVYSEWTYVLADLDELLSGKRVEFAYRVAGRYVTDGTRITSYYPATLEMNMTYPGSLFPYTTSTDFTTRQNSTRTEIYFDMSLSITFQYNYSAAIWQTIGPYYATAVGEA